MIDISEADIRKAGNVPVNDFNADLAMNYTVPVTPTMRSSSASPMLMMRPPAPKRGMPASAASTGAQTFTASKASMFSVLKFAIVS